MPHEATVEELLESNNESFDGVVEAAVQYLMSVDGSKAATLKFVHSAVSDGFMVRAAATQNKSVEALVRHLSLVIVQRALDKVQRKE